MKRISTLQILNIVFFVITLVINFLSQAASQLGINAFPKTVAELGESRAILFLPAGYVFAIWGVIYFGLGAMLVYLSRPAQRANPALHKIGIWFIVSCIANAGWLVLFLADQVGLSTVAMLVLLASLLIIYLRLGIGVTPVSARERWLVHIPFSIYLGWITVATVANISAALYVENFRTAWLGLPADVWTVIMLAIAALITLGMVFTRRDVAYALVIIWAVGGIIARPFTTDIYATIQPFNGDLVKGAAIAVIAVVALAVVVRSLLMRGASARMA
jgi:hypothetical protein